MKFSVGALTMALAVTQSTASESSSSSEEEQCRLYMAPSILSDKTSVKFGLYAGVDFDIHQTIPDVEIGIPFVDFFLDFHKQDEYERNIADYLENQMWAADFASSKFEGNHSTSPFFPGMGAIGNYHALISNADWLPAASFLREREDITEPGQPHLSRGAITNLYNVTMVATERIPAGMEIFPNYGNMWDKDEATPFQDKLTRHDFAEADKVVEKIVEFYEAYGDQMSETLKEDMLDFMLDKVLATAGGARAANIKSLIPHNYKKLKSVVDTGGSFLYRHKNFLRSPKWFQKNGICVDSIRSAKSTIPEAGRGAFATRSFAKGDVVSVIPTLLLGKKDMLNMYDVQKTTTGNKELVYDKKNPRGQQIAVNYMYGHSESTMYLLPMAPGVNLVNHHQDPNVKLRWSEHPAMSNDANTWDHSVEEVQDFRSTMVVFEFEAVRGIAEGDEIFLDYGVEWVRAWEDYKSLWEDKYEGKPWPLRAEDVKMAFREKPYPLRENSQVLGEGVRQACFLTTTNVEDGTPTQTEDGQDIYEFDGPFEYAAFTGEPLTHCDLVSYVEDGQGSYLYTVETDMTSDGQTFRGLVQNVPHAAITVVDAAYTSDLHLLDAFRHPIGIPDEIFPQNWRNLR